MEFSGVLDVRAAHSSQQRGWRDGGSGKLRYGGKDINGDGVGDRDRTVFGVPQLSLLIDAPLPGDIAVHVQTVLGADTAATDIGVIEAYASGSRLFELGRFSLKAGGFIPAISREHTERAWSTRHTLTPSALGSWIGEEVRAYGAESSWKRSLIDESLDGKLTGGVFFGGDGSGRLLLYRGWGMHDYQAHLDDSLSAPVAGEGKPFAERDGRPGFYARSEFSVLDERIKIFSGYWDNNGDHERSPPGTALPDEIWNTQFGDGGFEIETRSWSLIGHAMSGQSASRGCPRWQWQAWYALASWRPGAWTLSGRYDRFEVNRREFENGYALTADLMRRLGESQQFALEYIYLLARPNIATRPASRKDQLVQLNYRLIF